MISLFGCKSFDCGVKLTISANSIETSWCFVAMSLSPAFNLSAISFGKIFSKALIYPKFYLKNQLTILQPYHDAQFCFLNLNPFQQKCLDNLLV